MSSQDLYFHNNIPNDALQPNQHSGPNGQTKQWKGVRRDIALASFFLIVPMFLLTGALFYLVFEHRVSLVKELHPHLDIGQNGLTRDAFYVDINSTFLIFVASWMSSLAPMLVGCAITLATFHVAQNLFRETINQEKGKILTPYQLGLVLKIINGSTWKGLCSLATHFVRSRETSFGRCHALDTLAMIIVTSICISITIFGADTWLHVATSTIPVTQLSGLSTSAAAYSFSMIPECTVTNNSAMALFQHNQSCSIYPGPEFETYGTPELFMVNGAAISQTLNDQSDEIEVQMHHNETSNDIYAYLSPASKDPNSDFTATTFAVRTSCKPTTRACDMAIRNVTFSEVNGTEVTTEDVPETTFNCTEYFARMDSKLDTYGYEQKYAADSDMVSGVSPFLGTQNPVYLGRASLVSRSSTLKSSLVDDPEIYTDDWMIGAVVFCTIEAFDVEYDLVRNEITRFETQSSNSSVASAFNAIGISYSFIIKDYISAATDLALQTATTAQDFADQIALSISKMTISSAAASVQRTPVLTAQRRIDMLVARVPKAPLLLLIIMNGLFIFLGCILTVLAVRTSQEGREIRRRLTISGIVMDLFERGTVNEATDAVEHWIGECDVRETLKVGVDRSSTGGFVFKTLQRQSEIVKDAATGTERNQEGWIRSTPLSPQGQYGVVLWRDKILGQEHFGEAGNARGSWL